MSHLMRFFVGAAAWALAVPAFAEGPARLVADLAPGSFETYQGISGFARVGNRSVFLRNDNENYALWVTDGTAQGTRPVGVLFPPTGGVELLGSSGALAFYQVSERYDTFDTRIWRTDGTPQGTFPVTGNLKLQQAVPGSSVFGIPASINGGRLFFTGCTAELGCELWSSDGSPAGTAPVGEIVAGPGSGDFRELAVSGDQAFLIVAAADGSSSLWHADGHGRSLARLRETPRARLLTAGAGRAFFVAQDDGLEIWTSDGTAAGTRSLTSYSLPDPFEGTWFLKFIDGRIYFAAGDGLGTELWSLGEQPGSLRRLTDFSKPSVSFGSVENAGDRIVFLANVAGQGASLWSTRGDLRSTSAIAACPGRCPLVVSSLVNLGDGRFAFYGRDRRRDGFWVTDGTSGGTRLLKHSDRRYDHVQWAAGGGRVLFEIINEYSIGELWVTDGSAAGTFFVINGGPNWSHYYGFASPLNAGAANGRLVFAANTSESTMEVLWSSDGSSAGTRPLHQAVAAKSSKPQRLLGFRDGLLFQSCVDNVWELRFLRGAESSRLLSRLSDDHPCETSSLPPIEAGGLAYFSRYQDGISLWRTDGTATGTTAIVPAAGAGQPIAVTPFGGQAAYWLALPGPDNSLQSQLWRTDGSPTGTQKLVDLPLDVAMEKLADIGEKLYFFDANWQGTGFAFRPWVSDGTPSGTYPLLPEADPIAPDVPYDQLSFVGFGGRVFFTLSEGTGNVEIWSTDGTPAGTSRAVTAASGMLDPKALSVTGGRLYFAARRLGDSSGRLLPWVSDGTDAGTVPLADVELGTDSSAPLDRPSFVALGGRVFFAASDPVHGEELWATDGTPAGTALIRDIATGHIGSYPRSLVVWRGQLWFRARDRLHGMELWTSDGSRKGTRLVQDIAAGPSWSTPGELTATEESLYFSANDGAQGRELWVLPADQLPPP